MYFNNSSRDPAQLRSLKPKKLLFTGYGALLRTTHRDSDGFISVFLCERGRGSGDQAEVNHRLPDKRHPILDSSWLSYVGDLRQPALKVAGLGKLRSVTNIRTNNGKIRTKLVHKAPSVA